MFKRILFLVAFLLVIIDVTAQFTNVLISGQNTPNEPSIAIDYNNTNTLLAGSNINNYYISNDGGLTWSENIISSSLGVWGDPAMLIDDNGSFYFFHLANGTNFIDRIICQKSIDNGVSWSDGTYFGLNGDKDQDKEWIALDRNNGNIYALWTEFDFYGSTNSFKKTRILFTKSTDSGNTWSSPIKINEVNGDCVDSSNTVEGAVPAIGPNGEIYTAWAGPDGIIFDKSVSYGLVWSPTDVIVDPLPTGWDFNVPGLDRCNGLPITKCDISGGNYNGTIYVNWSDQRNGNDDTDIWLKKSTDGGDTWSNLIRVNNDPVGTHQFLSWMDIDQTNGNIYIVYYSRENYNDNRTDVYLAYSTNGGDTFENVKISETPFVPNPNVFFGDYTNIAAHNGVIRPIWSRMDNSATSIWTAIVNENALLSSSKINSQKDYKIDNYPNPISDELTISFELDEMSSVDLSLYAVTGQKLTTFFVDKKCSSGKNILKIPFSKLNLKSGIYFYKLKIGGQLISRKIIVK